MATVEQEKTTAIRGLPLIVTAHILFVNIAADPPSHGLIGMGHGLTVYLAKPLWWGLCVGTWQVL